MGASEQIEEVYVRGKNTGPKLGEVARPAVPSLYRGGVEVAR